MDDLRRMYYVVEHYRQLQGLRLLPLGVALLLAAALGPAFAPPGLPRAGLVLALMAAGVALSFPIRSYYASRFGRAAPRRWRTGAGTLIASALALLALACLQGVWPVPVSLPMLFVSVALARLGLVAGRLRVHYLWIAAGCAAFAILPLLGVPLAVRSTAFDVLLGGALIVAGIGDDRVLRRMMTMQAHGGRTSA